MTRTLAKTHPTKNFCETAKLSDEYNDIYFTRYSILSSKIIAKNPFPGVQREDIPQSSNPMWFTGTIYRQMKNKPNMIDDVYKINHGELPVHEKVFADQEHDTTYIEPKIGRPLPITGDLGDLVTGCVVAVRGKLVFDHFEVEEIETVGFEPPAPAPKQKGKILFVSGLLLDTSLYNSKVAVLLDWLSGYLGDTSDITQIVVAGNSLKEPPPQLIGSRVTRPVLGASAIFDFVKLIQGAARDLPVHLMPGDTDPAPVALPQKPFHTGLFSGARSMIQDEALILESNPVAFATDADIQFLGSSGQPILDMLRYDPKSSPLDLLCRTLDWGHLCPTAPDTVPTYPYADSDPLIIDKIPHVYFAGNMPEFASTMYNGVRVLCIPEFHSTGQVVEMDLETLEVETLTVA